MLISSFQPSKILILLLASCFIWIGGISLGLVLFMGTSVTMGWIIAGFMVMALAVWVIVMAREIRQAIVLPDPFSREMIEDGPVSEHSTPALDCSAEDIRKAPFARRATGGRRIALRFRSQARKDLGLPRNPAAGR